MNFLVTSDVLIAITTGLTYVYSLAGIANRKLI